MNWAIALTLFAFASASMRPASVSNSSPESSANSHSKSTASTKAPLPGSNRKGTVSSAHTSRAHGHRRYTRWAAPSYQLHPDPERYQQIQQALADRGYFKGEVNGQWGDDSVDALKRFQADRKLEPDGKINALSLFGLGLGPKHDGAVGSAPLPETQPLPPPNQSAVPQPDAAPAAAPEGPENQ